MDRKYLRQRRRTWYVRVRVPPSLQNKIGRQEIVRSLKTQDIDEARQKRWAAVAEIKGYLDAMFGKGRLSTELDQAKIFRGMVAMGQMTENMALQSWAFHNRSSFIGDELPDLDIVRLGQAIIKGEAQETATPITERLEMHLKELAGYARKQTVQARRKRIEALLNWTKAETFPELTKPVIGGYIRHLVKEGKLAKRTVRVHLSEISAFLNWCVDSGFLDNNPAQGVSRTLRGTGTGSTTNKRRPWTKPEIDTLIEASREREFHFYPLILIALYTGMRVNEICEMPLSNIEEEAFFVSEGKNQNSVRHIPIHPMLEHVVLECRAASQDGYLIPGLKRGGADGKRHHYFTKRFSAWTRKQLGLTDPGTVFHSFRMNFSQALENAGVPVTTAELLLGHRRQSMSYGTYSRGPEFKVLEEAIKAVKY